MNKTDVVAYAERVGALSVVDIKAQVNLIQHVMKEVMQGPTKEIPEGVHYGVIPGTPKPTLYKAGAEKLCLTFRLDPQYELERWNVGDHLFIVSKCTLWHIPSGQRYGSGMGSCSTKESKYAYRSASPKCPTCGKEAIIKGREEYGGGFVCFKKKGGCGAKFDDADERITKQPTGRVPNEDVADQYNTVLKMANKRSLVAAVLNATAASDIFTQDVEDIMPPAAQPPAANSSHAEIPSAAAGAAAGVKTRSDTLRELCLAAGGKHSVIQLCERAGVAHPDELSEDDYSDVCAMLKRKAAKATA